MAVNRLRCMEELICEPQDEMKNLRNSKGDICSASLIDISEYISKGYQESGTELLAESMAKKEYKFPEKEIISENFNKIFLSGWRKNPRILLFFEGIGSGERENNFFDCFMDKYPSEEIYTISVDKSRATAVDIYKKGDHNVIIGDITTPGLIKSLKEERAKLEFYRRKLRTICTLFGNTFANLSEDAQKESFEISKVLRRPGDLFLISARTVEKIGYEKNYGAMISEYSQPEDEKYIRDIFERSIVWGRPSLIKIDEFRKNSEFRVYYNDKEEDIISCLKFGSMEFLVEHSRRFSEDDIKKVNGRLFPKFNLSFYYDNAKNPTCMVVACRKEGLEDKIKKIARKSALPILAAAGIYSLSHLYNAYDGRIQHKHFSSLCNDDAKIEFLEKKNPEKWGKIASDEWFSEMIMNDLKEQKNNKFLYKAPDKRTMMLSNALEKGVITEESIKDLMPDDISGWNNYIGMLTMQQQKVNDTSSLFENARISAKNDTERVISIINKSCYQSLSSLYGEAIKTRDNAQDLLSKSKSINADLKKKLSEMIFSWGVIDETYNLETLKAHKDLRKRLTARIRENADKETIADSYFALGRLDFRDKRYADAEKNLLIARSIGNQKTRESSMHELADLRFDQGFYDESINLCDKILNYSKSDANQSSWTTFIKMKSLALRNLSDKSKKDESLEKLLEKNYTQFENGDNNGMGWNRYFKAIYDFSKGDVSGAYALFTKSHWYLHNAKKESDSAKAEFQMGRCAYLLKNYSEAETSLNHALGMFNNKSGVKLDTVVWTKEAAACAGYLAKVYEKLGDENQSQKKLAEFEDYLMRLDNYVKQKRIGNNKAISLEMGMNNLVDICPWRYKKYLE